MHNRSMLSRDRVVVKPQRAALGRVGNLATEEESLVSEGDALKLLALFAHLEPRGVFWLRGPTGALVRSRHCKSEPCVEGSDVGTQTLRRYTMYTGEIPPPTRRRTNEPKECSASYHFAAACLRSVRARVLFGLPSAPACVQTPLTRCLPPLPCTGSAQSQ